MLCTCFTVDDLWTGETFQCCLYDPVVAERTVELGLEYPYTWDNLDGLYFPLFLVGHHPCANLTKM